MKKRYLAAPINELCLQPGKMAVVSGPRQCGKTTLARMMLNEHGPGRYCNWDDVEFRRLWTKAPRDVVPAAAERGKRPFLVLDEIHKDRRWKSRLKGVYDTLEQPCNIVVTGSARLNVYRRGSDSLLGRYFHFRLHPFSLREMFSAAPGGPDALVDRVFERAARATKSDEKRLTDLERFGPFPEPLLAQSEKRARLWRRSRSELIIREDLRDLSRIPDLGRVEMMASLLADKVGSMFSTASLAEDLEVAPDTVKRWLSYLGELYYLFAVRPYTRRIRRSLRKIPKLYLWDFGEVKDEAARFENLIACHLLKACHYWTDTGEGEFELRYLRNKEKREIDFLVVRDGAPWLPVEVKLNDTQPASAWRHFIGLLPCRRAIQVVRGPAFRVHEFPDSRLAVVGAAEFLRHMV